MPKAAARPVSTPAPAPVVGAWSDEAASWVDIAELEPWDRNPKRNDSKIGQAVRSLRDFGFGSPMVRDAERKWLVGGNARLKGMRKILEEDPELDGKGGTSKKLAKANALLRESLRGPTVRHLPVRWMRFESEARAEAYAMVDNNQIGEWDVDALTEMVARTTAAEIELESLGFSDDILRQLAGGPLGPMLVDDAAIGQEVAGSRLEIVISCATTEAGRAQAKAVVERCIQEGWAYKEGLST